MLMISKTRVTFSIVAIAAAIGPFASGPLVATHQAQAAFGFGEFRSYSLRLD